MNTNTFMKRRDFVTGHTAPSRTPTDITTAGDILRRFPHLYEQIRAEGAADERRRIKAQDPPPQDEKTAGETLMEQAAERRNAARQRRNTA